MAIKVIVADDHSVVRHSLVNMLQKRAEIEVVGDTGDGRTVVTLCGELMPDVVIMDVGLPELNGIEATRQIVSEFPKVKIIGLSMHTGRTFVVKMLKAGAVGYLPKSCTFRELLEAINAAAKGQFFLSPAVAGYVVQGMVKTPLEPEEEGLSLLTTREREVMQLLVEGKTIREICDTLFVSVKTAETHRRNIMEKLNLRTLADLTKYAIREGITTVDF